MEKLKKYRIALIIIILLIIIDQSLKIISSINWQNESKVIVEGVLSTTHYKNTGGFMGQSKSMFSLIVTDIIIIALILRFLTLQYENMNLLTKVSLSTVVAGGISNLIDRIILGGIIDYIHFTNITLNFADVYEILGFILFALSMAIYTYSEIKKKKQAKKEEV